MAALNFVDGITFFEQDTPLQLIRSLTPDVLVKGGDWAPDQIVGSDWVIEHGGIVKSLPFVSGEGAGDDGAEDGADLLD